jgi:predicted peptidase
MIIKRYLFLLCFLLAGTLHAQDFNKYEKGAYISKGDTLPYRILFPEDFDPGKKYPVVFVLHGAGERGNNNEAQLTHGGKLFLDQDNRRKFPSIVVFPQCPASSFWSNVAIETNEGKFRFSFPESGKPTKAMSLLLGLVNTITKKPYANRSQLYVGGLSMGGMGTFELLYRKPKLFAAAFPICGGGNTNSVRKYAKNVSLWVFHGAKDSVVSPDYSFAMVEALKNANADVRFTEYPNADHNSWDAAFAETEFLSWLFSHQNK